MSTKFTPGPWRVGFEHPAITADIVRRNPGFTPIVGPLPPFAFGGVVAITEGEANARLIAKAPEMYALVKMLSTDPCACPLVPGCCGSCIARALLAEIDGVTAPTPEGHSGSPAAG